MTAITASAKYAGNCGIDMSVDKKDPRALTAPEPGPARTPVYPGGGPGDNMAHADDTLKPCSSRAAAIDATAFQDAGGATIGVLRSRLSKPASARPS
jgi:hypothetical protein